MTVPKIGLEIHQRLASECKLFCRCPSSSDAEEKVSLHRRLRAVTGELGIRDRAAVFQAGASKEFAYAVSSDSSCLVESDEQFPFSLNEEALAISVAVSRALRCTLVDEVHVMRKTVVDGSACSGFQRTSLIGTHGSIDSSKGPIGILSVCLEEESAAIRERAEHGDEYGLSRQGIPLVEIATSPGMQSGAHAKEVAERIGMLLRSTRVQRGIGTIRQDLNVSIPEGARVEVKGVQTLEDIPSLVDNEVSRQEGLVAVARGLKGKNFSHSQADVTSLLKSTKAGIVSKALSQGGVVLAIKLSYLKGILGRELLPGRRVGSELADYARAQGLGGMFHSDENLGKYGFSEEEAKAIAVALSATSDDAFCLFAGPKARAQAAADAVVFRASLLFSGVPEETRKANGSLTSFLRPLPGAARMYPETDVAPVSVASVSALAARLEPKPLEAVASGFASLGLSPDLAEKLARSEEKQRFERMLASKAEPKLVASFLLETTVALRRQGVAVEKVDDAQLLEMFKAIAHSRMVPAGMEEALKGMAEGKAFDAVLKERKLGKMNGKEMEALVSGLKAKGSKNIFVEVMAQHRVRVDARELAALLKGV